MASLLATLLIQERSEDIRRLLVEGFHDKINLNDCLIAAECYAHLDEEDRAACLIEWESFSRSHSDVIGKVKDMSYLPDEYIEAKTAGLEEVGLAKQTVHNLFTIAVRGMKAAHIIEDV